MALDFAIKDFYRKREISIPFVLVITLIIALTIFTVYFTSALGLNALITYNFTNEFFFSGGISLVYSDFTTLIIILILILAFIVVNVVASTLVISKKRDIAIMKALGSLPRKLYNLYLTEVYLIFIMGFIFGLLIGLASFGLLSFIFNLIGIPILFKLDFFYTPILFFSCLLGIYFIPGAILRKIGSQRIVTSFSKDIPFDYDSSKRLTFIPKWLSKIGFNFKISVVNTIRRRGEFRRYLAVFSIISLIIFTLTLGILVLNNSARAWVSKSQSTNVLAIGHENVLQQYSLMYSMFSNPEIIVTNNSIDFLDPSYLFNLTEISSITLLPEVKCVDKRIISFFKVEERKGYHCYEDGGCYLIGQERKSVIPLIGVNTSTLIQDFEIEGDYFSFPDDEMFIGDGLAYNFFEYPLDQLIWVEEIAYQFHISGVAIDTFYSGFTGYLGLEFLQNHLGYNQDQINLLLLKIENHSIDELESVLDTLLQTNLGSEFDYLNLESTFKTNLDYINSLSLYPFLIILLMGIVSLVSLYNYQKGGIIEKAKDFLIMRAIGTKYKYIKRIMFMEAFYVIVPSLVLSLGTGMILNSLFIFQRVFLPHISIPFITMGVIFVIFLIINYFSLFPILKKVKSFSIKDFDIY